MRKAMLWISLSLGIVLIVGAVLWVVLDQTAQKQNREDAVAIADQLISSLPTSFDDGSMADRPMPRMEVDGSDFIAVLSVPGCGTRLPVYADWEPDRIRQYPCRFTGSLYDGSFVVGGSDNPGQLDFMKAISIGDAVFVTDMRGCQFHYTVSDIQLTEDVSVEALTQTDAPLTLFARDTYGLHYTVIRCDFS